MQLAALPGVCDRCGRAGGAATLLCRKAKTIRTLWPFFWPRFGNSRCWRDWCCSRPHVRTPSWP